MASTYLPRQIEIGKDCLNKLGKIASEMGVTNLFVVIDAFLVTLPLSYDQRIKEIVQSENMTVTFFSDYQGEPTTDHVKAALKSLVEKESDCVVAIGGGSAIDIAKAVSLFGANPKMRWEEIAATKKLNRLPLIAVPTTAGTGSEATKVMVVTNLETQLKMNPAHKDLIPDVAILDPVLTQSLPRHFTAYTGMDALTHAIEAYISTQASVMTDNYALTAIKMIGKSLPRVYENGMDLEAREAMLLASCYSGIAFSNASTNLAHAIGRSLGARFNIPHGLSVSLMLPFVMRFGLEVTKEKYADIGIAMGMKNAESKEKMAESTIQLIEEMNSHYGIWQDGMKYINLEDLNKNKSTLINDALSGNGILTNQIVPTEKDVEVILLSLIGKLEELGSIQMASS
ncbi:iron-containing alcohol dehydrogenase [Sporosarcina sp. YIM B06819]|uniref:iron-containing alcohol dehydrogenase n=1 Tax=Sporosarcina sp. YIM B06819 TaxID=3081769 RepID=UPI00298D37BA|nr:iron-containing alcohol dehydrogenase [Sporosarcina sp. YIM B06819]